MTLFKRRLLIPRISFASTTVKLWRPYLYQKSTLNREYPPRRTSQKPWLIQTPLHYPPSFLRARCGLRRLIHKWSRCSGYLNYTEEHHQEANHSTFHRLLLFTVPAALSHSRHWGAQCTSICKSPWQFNHPLLAPYGLRKFFRKICILWRMIQFDVRDSHTQTQTKFTDTNCS